MAEGRSAGGSHRRSDPARRTRREAGRQRPGVMHGRLPDRLGDTRRHHARRLRRRQHRPAARREQRPRQSVRRREESRGQALHLLQQVPRPRGGASNRLLRGKPVRQSLRNARAGDVGLPAAGVRMTTLFSQPGPLSQRAPVWRVLLRWIVGLALAFALAIGLWAFVSMRVDRPEEYADIVEHFKYGSIGSEPGGSLLQTVGGVLPPYWIFRALPDMCPDKLPGGYASLGLV